MNWVRADERTRIWEAGAEEKEGWTKVDADLTGWTLLDYGVPLYALTEDGRVRKRTDAEVKRDKKGRRQEE